MRRNNLLYLMLFLLFISNIQAQKFEFDLLTKYQSMMKNYIHESVIYSNSKNEKYFLYVDGNTESKNAILYDFANMISHNFKVKESKIQNEMFFEFEYLNSKNINLENKFGEFELEYKSIGNDSLKKEIKIDIYDKTKKLRESYVLRVKKSKTNLFPLFRFSCLHPLEFNQNINLPENIMVENAIGTTLSGKTIEHKLLYNKELKFEIEIPKNTNPSY
jgi:hypothetical protein